MNSFVDASRFRIENGNAVYNSINDSYLEKALDGVPIELCYNDNEQENTKTLIQKTPVILEKKSINLERCSSVYKKIIKEKYLKKKTKKAKNTKRKHGHYKNFDIDNQCEICGIIGSKHEVGCKNELQNTLDYENMQYYNERMSFLRDLFSSHSHTYNFANEPNYYNYTVWKKKYTDYDDITTIYDYGEDNYDEEAVQASLDRRLLEIELRQLSRLNGTEFLNDDFF